MNAIAMSSAEACRLADITYRQLDYWTRNNAITPTIDARGSGSQRGWSPLDVACLRAIGEVANDLATLGIGDVPSAFVAQLWTRLRTHPDVVVCQGTLTISLSRPLIGGC